ncbi:MAG: hypothetical protein ACYS1A_19680 [Planctomycetota bacterium]
MIEKVKTGWLVPVKLKESFVNFCAEKGNVAQEDCAGALLIWQYLPAQTRELARLEAKGIQSADKTFWKQFSQGLELGVQAQLNIQRQKQEKEKPPKVRPK